VLTTPKVGMDLNEIYFFTQVVRAGSFTQAARVLGIPKSKVSRKVQELEKRLGVSLLQRTTRSLALSDAGGRYFKRCSRAMDEITAAEVQATDAQQSLNGTIRMTAPVDFGASFLGALISEFLTRHPKVNVELALTDATIELSRERFDLALKIGQLKDSSLVAKKIGYIECRAFAAPGYLETHGTPLTPQELPHHSCLGFLMNGATLPWTLSKEKTTHQLRVGAFFSTNNVLLIYQRAVAGDGIAYLPTFLCAKEVREERLVPVLENWRYRGASAYLVFPGRKFIPKRIQVFSDFLVPRFKNYFQ
jgi:DNA-binding transcriptional LysR family regulator